MFMICQSHCYFRSRQQGFEEERESLVDAGRRCQPVDVHKGVMKSITSGAGVAIPKLGKEGREQVKSRP